MLVNGETRNDEITDAIAKINGNPIVAECIGTGVYEIGHFNFNHMLEDYELEQYPEFEDWFDSYGVCDNYSQILEHCPEIEKSERKFVIALTPIIKQNQSSKGGWRWHKWGPYIGVQESKAEYMYDEPNINKVYCYHIYEIVEDKTCH